MPASAICDNLIEGGLRGLAADKSINKFLGIKRDKKGDIMKEQFTISVFTENHIGILSRITIIFTRRHINIESLTVSETEVHGISRYTIVVSEEGKALKRLSDNLNDKLRFLRPIITLSMK